MLETRFFGSVLLSVMSCVVDFYKCEQQKRKSFTAYKTRQIEGWKLFGIIISDRTAAECGTILWYEMSGMCQNPGGQRGFYMTTS